MGEVILQITDLNIGFSPDFHVVHQVSFDVKKGETVGIVGESGSGKSITSLAIMGLLPSGGLISNGTIDYFSQETNAWIDCTQLQNLKDIRGKKIAMIFQEPMTALNPVFTCGYQVSEMLITHLKISATEAKKITLDLFNEVKLPRAEEMYDKYPHQISGGQKQRVMIAMAISCNPDVLIADEPTTALDVTVQKNILDLLKEIQTQRNMGMIFISHDLGIIKNIANQVLVMQKGNVVEQGSADAIFNHAQHVYTKALIACKPPLDKRFEQLPTVQDFIKDPSGDFIRESNPQNRVLQHQKIYQVPPILQVQNLSVYYPNQTNFWGKTTSFVKAVNEVSFEVYPGETLGLIGESGCGKTTIGRTIVGLQEITQGNIIFKDKSIKEFNAQDWAEYRKSVQIIFQDPYSSLNPRLTIGKAIQEPIAFYNKHLTEKELKEKVEYLLLKVGLLPEHYNRYPHEFSGGQRQRISIARTLALEPKFIICDESVSALDVSVQAQVLNILNDLKAEFGLSYIFISHDLSVIKYMCDRMIVLNKNGEVEEKGECDSIYANPKSTYTQKLIAAIPQ